MNSYCLYSDESGHKRYRSIGVLSGEKGVLSELDNELQKILDEYNTRCVEFKEINGDNRKESAAKEYFETGVRYCCEDKIRIDILSWDTQDSRHEIRGRDDQKNLEVMYYKVINWAQKQYHLSSSYWEFYPDQNSAINWDSLIKFVEHTNLTKDQRASIFGLIDQFHFPTILEHEEAISDEEPLIQLVDIYAGFGPFTLKHGDVFLEWRAAKKHKNSNQETLFDIEETEPGLSRGKGSKFKVLKYFDSLCKKHKMGVSIRSEKYLKTFDPKNNINYWFYEPQGDYDEAPVR